MFATSRLALSYFCSAVLFIAKWSLASLDLNLRFFFLIKTKSFKHLFGNEPTANDASTEYLILCRKIKKKKRNKLP